MSSLKIATYFIVVILATIGEMVERDSVSKFFTASSVIILAAVTLLS